MSRTITRSILVAALAGGAVAASAAPASAACYGTQNVGVVCYANRTVYSDCVYVGSPPCTPVTVSGPVCVYGGGETWVLWTIGCSL